MPTQFERQQTEGERIAGRVVQGEHIDGAQLARWIEGASERLLQQEQEIRSLKFNLYMLFFVLIGIPILARLFGG